MATSLILDTDIGGDVDDALALAFALRHPELDLRAVTTVSGDTVRRGRVAKRLLLLAGRDDIEVAAGERGECGDPDEWIGDDGAPQSLSARDAVTLLLDECRAHRHTIAAVGMQTNVAAALARDASFAGDVGLLAVMGGAFAPIKFAGRVLPPTFEYNLNVDAAAAVRALNAGMPTLYVPVDVTMSTWLMASHVDRLRDGDALCRELASHIDVHKVRFDRDWDGMIPPECMALLHDPLLVACLVDRRFVASETMRVSVRMHEGYVRTFVDEADGAEAEVVTSVDAAAFAEFWLETVLG